ncbi:hypothetical protein DXG03_002270 [Asterophora parasitica]|uniref:Uncharacterized protein n=1 Tax=Asterophora parasitica TaxID=117018 RepID=A0A9P7G4L5_9AGAR|nr:hypothetical protein DXG03_002270 [Asterophora parasitica]
MVTPAIPPGKRAIQAVRFTLLSNDQGQAPDIDIEENLRGTYQGSNTWFEAAIIRDDREEVPQYLFQVRQPRQPIDAFNRDAFTREQAREIKNSLKGTERWQLQYNVQAVCTPKLYQIVWMKGEVINDEVEAVSRSKGAGTGRGFVSTLRPGDRVALVLRAQHQGWANCIWGAEIEILHSV